MKCVFVNITSDLNTVPNLEKLLKKENAIVAKWKEKGIVEHLFVKEHRQGAILIFNDLEIKEIRQHLSDLPLSIYFKTVEFLPLDAIF